MYLCKDCKHSTMLMIDRILTFNGLVCVSGADHRCARFPQEATIVENMVTGPEKIKAKLPYCEIVRRHGACGQNAKYWAPKKKKDLFKMLTKENYD
jgi:hypothetical protein